MTDPQITMAEYATAARKTVYAYVRAVATGQIPPRKPEEYEWLAVLDSDRASTKLKELVWKQYTFESFHWGSAVNLADLEKLVEVDLSEREIKNRLWEIDGEIEALEEERDDLEDQLDLLRGSPERSLA